MIDLFEEKIDRSAGPDACHPWTACADDAGYGRYRLPAQGETVLAHREAFRRARGYLPPVVRHSCDYPPCCNERHLFSGTHADNVADRLARDRQPRGEAVGGARLTEDDVREIRSARLRGATFSSLGRAFGVTESNVRAIVNGRSWRHVA